MAHDCSYVTVSNYPKPHYIIDVRKIGHLNMKTKMFDIEARVLIGWYSPASQSEHVHSLRINGILSRISGL